MPADTHPTELSETELEELKRERLQYTVEYAYEHSPFYRELMDEHGVEPADIRAFEDLTQLPVVTGDDILANQPPNTDTFRFKNADANIRRPFLTSGTGGDPKTVFMSYDEHQRMYEEVRRGMRQLGVSEDDTVINYFPFVGLNISCEGNEGGLAKIGCETVPISNTPYPPEREYSLLRQHNPDVIIGLPSHVDAKGRQFEQIGGSTADLDIRLIIVAGEPVSESRKHYIGDVFDADVYEFLGTTEAGGFAWQCRTNEGLHVIDDSVHVDVVDENGHPVSVGKKGHLVVTNLLHPGEDSAMPLIRYEVGDLVSKYPDESEECECLLQGGTIIESPRRKGRQFSFGAVTISPQLFENHLYAHSELRTTTQSYQVRVEYDEDTGQDVATLLIESTDETLVGEKIHDVTPTDSPENVLESLGTELLDSNQHLRDTVDTVGAARINIEVVDEIEMPPGKPKRLIDNR